MFGLIVARSVNAAIECLGDSDARLKSLVGASSTEVMRVEWGLISNIISNNFRCLKQVKVSNRS